MDVDKAATWGCRTPAAAVTGETPRDRAHHITTRLTRRREPRVSREGERTVDA